MKPLVAFVLGGPGSGKGTQCKLICEEFNFKHLSAGDLLRAEREDPKSQYGDMIQQHINEGRIVPVEVTCSLLENAMSDHSKKVNDNGKFLIDGFPRNQDNLDGWARQMGHKVDEMFVLYLECPDDVCVNRCLTRGQQGNRSDDNETTLRKRLKTYKNDTMPIIERYRQRNQLITIDATKTPSEVYSEIRKFFIRRSSSDG